MKTAKIWEQEVLIPTYGIGEPDKNPMFLEKRVYQGSSGKVYPLPVIEKIEDEKKEKAYKAVFLENDYIQVMILPELGGRIQRALDKTNSYDFVYYNQVVKPALVGLAGPWISGGIEFNWPQHHRPSTFMPVEYVIEEHPDGSKTCHVSEIDQMYGTKGMASFTVYPDKAYIEIKGQLYNGTDVPQTFLWWANPAVAVNDYTQSVFPPDVHAVMDHGKRDVSRFPIATGTYYKMDYSSGVDISRYKNIPVPTSYMAYHSDYNFVGGYDHHLKAGILHIADHHVSPGKKQWTWGCGDFGKAWDRNLTDEDGPYIELMTGVFTDNQPDFTWLKPNESKQFTQYFMPYKEIDVVKNATIDAAISLECENGKIKAAVYATSEFPNAEVVLKTKNDVLFRETVTLSPLSAFEKVIEKAVLETELTLAVYANNGRLLVEYTPQPKENKPVPEPAKAALAPEDIKTTEELYLTALHLEQYRHATYDPEPYYLEGLKRDDTDIRINNGYGLLLYRRGRFAEAEKHFRKAAEKLTWKNPNPYDGEPSYNLGLSLRKQNRNQEAFDAFYKSAWSGEMQERAFYQLAALASTFGDFEEALKLVNQSIIKNYHGLKSRGLKAALLRKLGKTQEAQALVNETIGIDKLDFYSRFENYKLSSDPKDLAEFKRIMRGALNNYLVLSLYYLESGLYEEGLEVLHLCDAASPLVFYYKAYFHHLAKESHEAAKCFEEAAKASPLYCFPNKLEELLILETAVKLNPKDSYAHYYLGNLLYDKKQYEEAVGHFEISAKLNPNFPTVFRNLALAYYNKQQDAKKAVEALEKAYALDMTDARVLLELDQLYKILNRSHSERFALLNAHRDAVLLRDDLYLEYCALHNYTGQYETAYSLIMNRKFHPWEGGEGKVPAQYKYALTEMAKQAIQAKTYEKAIDLLNKTLEYPHNLGEGKLYGTRENNVYYYLGLCYKALGDEAKAKNSFEKAAEGNAEPTDAMFYNDQPADMIYYQGLALASLGREQEARSRFNKLKDYGEKHIFDHVKIDYFAVSLPDFLIFDVDLNKKNVIHCNYLIGLGYLGLGNKETAKNAFKAAYELDCNHLGVKTFLEE